MDEYQSYHAKRFLYLINLIKTYAPKGNERILEIGPGPFTSILCKQYENVYTLGISDENTSLDRAAVDRKKHINYNLLNCLDRSRWPDIGKFDLIIFAEVIEHLFFSARHVLAFFKSCLKSDGLIVCQTPNGANINNRLKLLFGQSPILPYGPDLVEPGHFREFTKKELQDIGASLGFRILAHEFKNYFGSANNGTKVLDLVSYFFPTLRRGQTIIFQNTTFEPEIENIDLNRLQNVWFDFCVTKAPL